MDTIREGYKDNLIDSKLIDLSDFEYDLKQGQEKCLNELKRNLEAGNLKDIHKRMSWWACFNEERSLIPALPETDDFVSMTPRPASRKDRKKVQAQKKKKKKQAKASKKKNRGKKKKK